MRVEIKLKPRDNGTILPFNYNYDIYNQLIQKIALISSELARLLETAHVDYFTFSRIMVRKRELIPDKGIRILSDEVCLYISSSVADVIKSIVEGFIENPILHIGDSVFIMDRVKVLREPKIKDGTLFSTLSPIMVRTVKLDGNKMKIWDLYPNEDLFHDKLRKIMLMRFSEIEGRMPEEKEFKIEVIKHKPVRIKVKDSYFRGSLMVFRYYGSREIAKFGYENGFGEKTKYGFGMVKVIDEEEAQRSQE
ncbi:CRISPR-associated endoribonuclease Cas6 [Thermococcus sp. M39]|uniref:CRISPR-associated endoribonuclease Cas6 n=1 Tax=unclassified Thermococcus TaxID=2627626 RepID=UPI00143886CB|nr:MULTISPECIES: CRISPR-associated endoribonuclease Cas6 [unclassified Thermococcus]NJE07842.1 CRISPR-associated endoribonuclease Cas6 [Thermococcus sp. M39]NJE13447.1 CRISPR-associated endoribonuclease Cas6 [Thermococcus sp. LS2]